jgi:hypothetical protein
MTLHDTFKRRVRARMSKTGERYAAARRVVLAERAGARRTWAAEPEIGDTKLKEVTGKGWDAWCDLIDGWPEHDRGHSAVASWVQAEFGIDGWWAQTVTVGWERITGRRVPYQMADGTFTISRSRTVTIDTTALRQALLSDDQRVDLFPGHDTVLRSRPTTKALRVAIGDGIALFTIDALGDGRAKMVVSHEKLPSSEAAEEWRFYWSEWLDAIDTAT